MKIKSKGTKIAIKIGAGIPAPANEWRAAAQRLRGPPWVARLVVGEVPVEDVELGRGQAVELAVEHLPASPPGS